ncbi:oleosin 1 [Populus alba x Populus x berolinensis]|uniref:Oleosin 1 n=1 Tax=Populus alba x Populus x berolinensis TaxID=444605 RepID=A0AAD6M077_9ROSI|nr:oleosin 1 [Populus alba x Populus x berolinensis]
MADRAPTQRATRPTTTPTTHSGSTFLRKLQLHIGSNSSQLVGLLTLIISGSVLLLLTGITVTGSVLGLTLLTPFDHHFKPHMDPYGHSPLLCCCWALIFLRFGLAVVAGLSWVYKYFRGLNPPGSDQVDYARNRIYDTASHVKDYAREYGGYLQSKVKDAAPGA